jgi:hypothetical protein
VVCEDWMVEAEGTELPTPHQVIEPSLCDAASYFTDFPKPEWQAAIEALQQLAGGCSRLKTCVHGAASEFEAAGRDPYLW